MIIRIDLLDPSERRYMGPVSGRFAKRISVFTIIALGLIGAVSGLYSGLECRQALQRGHVRWKELEPRFEATQRLKRRHSELGKYLEEIQSWKGTRLVAHTLLEDIQERVPPSIQFTRLEIRDEISAPRPKTTDEVVVPFRLLRVRINGRATGDRSEEIVARFINHLREMGVGNPLFRNVTLLAIQAETSPVGSSSTFEIDATGAERPMKLKLK